MQQTEKKTLVELTPTDRLNRAAAVRAITLAHCSKTKRTHDPKHEDPASQLPRAGHFSR